MKQRVTIILTELERLFPQASIMLHFSNPWELLVAVILSAQCTDKMVNKVTEKVFKKYPTFGHYLEAQEAEFERDIHSTGFYRMKTKHILECAKIIQSQYNGQVPRTMKELVGLPGVGRKTANVVLGNVYKVVEGIAVDTHVKRIAFKLGLTKHADPVKIELDLMRIIPRNHWLSFTYRIIEYGRKYCPARKHDHKNCPLTKKITLN